jgi:hypothetical protein
VVVGWMLALPLLQNQLLQVFVCENACILTHETVDRVRLLIVLPVLLVLQRFLRGNLIIYNFSFFALSFRGTGSLIDARRHEGDLCLP